MNIKRNAVKKLMPAKSKDVIRKAKEYGYDKPASDRLSESAMIKKKGKIPVSKDKNSTRRKMVKPTKRGSYAS